MTTGISCSVPGTRGVKGAVPNLKSRAAAGSFGREWKVLPLMAGLALFLAGMTYQPPQSRAAMSAAADGATVSAEAAAAYPRPPTKHPSEGRPLTAFKSANFIGSHYCYSCHHLLVDPAGNDISIISHWRSTMMANAAKDPFWQAMVQAEVQRDPQLKSTIEQKCLTCHMPMAWTQANAAGGYAAAAVMDTGYLDPKNSLHEEAMDGVSCSLCHQIQDKGLGTKETFTGNFKIDTTGRPPKRVIYGPFHDPVTRPMETGIGFSPMYGAQINHSALCGTCHTLFTPFVDSKGKIAGEFPEQTVFLEWRHSDYNVPDTARYDIGENPGKGKICQECHMPHTPPGNVIISKWAPPEVKPRDHFSQHFFVGGNVLLLDILEDNVDSLGLTASSAQLEMTKQRTLDQLRNRSARLAFGKVSQTGDTLAAPLTVENLAGHKYPSGFPSRRLWLHFTVKDGRGEVVFESGRPLASGAIQGNDNDEDPARYEPHYTEITDPGQVQIYETIMADTDGRVTYTLLRASTYAKDNCLLPRGFDKKSAAPEIAVEGGAANDDDFKGGSDTILYRVDTGGRPGPFSLTAELLYSPLSYSFLEDLRRESSLDLVARFLGMADRADKMPVAVASATATLR